MIIQTKVSIYVCFKLKHTYCILLHFDELGPCACNKLKNMLLVLDFRKNLWTTSSKQNHYACICQTGCLSVSLRCSALSCLWMYVGIFVYLSQSYVPHCLEYDIFITKLLDILFAAVVNDAIYISHNKSK